MTLPECKEKTAKDFILEYLKKYSIGAENAASGRKLSSMSGVTPSDIRRVVNELRSEKHPVCSDSNGYFYASSVQEIDMTIAHLASRVKQINKAKDGLYGAKIIFVSGIDPEGLVGT